MASNLQQSPATPPASLNHSNWVTSPLQPKKSPDRLARTLGLGHGATRSLNLPRPNKDGGPLDIADLLKKTDNCTLGSPRDLDGAHSVSPRGYRLQASDGSKSPVHDPTILSPRPRRHTNLQSLDTNACSVVSTDTGSSGISCVEGSSTPPSSIRSSRFKPVQLGQPLRRHIRGARSLSPQRHENMFSTAQYVAPSAVKDFNHGDRSLYRATTPPDSLQSSIVDHQKAQSSQKLFVDERPPPRRFDYRNMPQLAPAPEERLRSPITATSSDGIYIQSDYRFAVPTQDEFLRRLRSRRKAALSSSARAQLTWARDVLRLADRCQARQARVSRGLSNALVLPLYELRSDALELVENLCEQGMPLAQFMRGLMLEFGLSETPMDKVTAVNLYKEAAAAGCSRAEFRLGMYHERKGDMARACEYYERGAVRNDAASLYRLGIIHILGQYGYAEDQARGVNCIKLSTQEADSDAPQGAFVYALLLCGEAAFNVSTGVLKPDNFLAVSYLEKAAELGFSPAQLRLGKAHEYNELGCEFSPTMSVHYYTLAAQGNETEADMALSKWFLAGSDDGAVPRDEDKAYFHADLAARRGLASAEFAMGYFHEVGIACDANVKRAQEYYRQAAEHGSEEARARIDGLARSGTISRRDHEHNVSTKIVARHATIKLNQSQANKARSRAKSYAPVLKKPVYSESKSSIAMSNTQKSDDHDSLDQIVESLEISSRAAPGPIHRRSKYEEPEIRIDTEAESGKQANDEAKSWAPSSPKWSEMERTRSNYQTQKGDVSVDYYGHSRVKSWTQDSSARTYQGSPDLAPSELSTISEIPITKGSPRPESSVSNIPPFRLPQSVLPPSSVAIAPPVISDRPSASVHSIPSTASRRAGPATFEEMGIPIAPKKKEECTLM